MIFYYVVYEDDLLEITEKEILHSYWDWWEEKMFKKYGNYTLITNQLRNFLLYKFGILNSLIFLLSSNITAQYSFILIYESK